MNLISEHPYWLMRDGIPFTYPSLNRDISTDVAIIGAGISGTLMAYYLSQAGINAVQVDRRHAATGSTMASTSLLQYEIDMPMRELAEKRGEDAAARSYHLCREAIYTLRDICSQLPSCCQFHLRPSLQYASYKKDEDGLYKEYLLRKKHGFNVSWAERNELKKDLGLEANVGILSGDGAEINAYLTTHHLLQKCKEAGNKVYDNTNVTGISSGKKTITLHTDTGYKISAKKVVMACGYETLNYIPEKITQLLSTYALVTEPVDEKHVWKGRALIWETATPYMYYRVTSENRILIGGKDDEFYNPDKRDAAIRKKSEQLEHSFHKRFPKIPTRTDFRWAGTFATTRDGLPYIGTRDNPNIYFALGFGGNGITYSVIAAQLLTDLILGKKNKDLELFRFGR